MLPKAAGRAGVSAPIGRKVLFDGVSGMLTLLPNDAGIVSMLRLRLEMSPVDMKAAGSGLAIL